MATIEGNNKILTVLGEEIEESVSLRHTHSNKEQLDKIGEDSEGNFTYNNNTITATLIIPSSEPTNKTEGTIWIVG